MRFDVQPTKHKKYMDVVARIKKDILDGRLAPGDRLPSELDMVEQYETSRTPIREAIKILEAVGIIEIRRGDGMYLHASTSQLNLNPLIVSLIIHSGDVEKVTEFRQYFEHMIIEMVWARATPDDLCAIVDVYKKQIRGKSLDPDSWVNLDLAFHHSILEATHNPFAVEIGRTVYEMFRPRMVELAKNIGFVHTVRTHKLYIKVITGRKEEDFDRLKRQIAWNYSRVSSS